MKMVASTILCQCSKLRIAYFFLMFPVEFKKWSCLSFIYFRTKPGFMFPVKFKIWPCSNVYWGSRWRGGSPNPVSNLKMTLSHFIVAKEMVLSHVTNQKWLCCMSLTILSPMSPVKFKKWLCCLSLISVVACGF